ncbi:MAG: response regulator [Lachnospiraceae bacterium]|nr:response regulator [Lachnospiraceae bacterium]
MIRMEVMCFLILFFIATMFFSAKRVKSKIHNTFSLLLVTAIINIILDIITVYIVYNIDSVPILYTNIIHRLFFITMEIVFFLIYRYIIMLVEDESHDHIKVSCFSTIILAIFLICLCILPIYYAETVNGCYSYGPSTDVLHFSCAIYIIMFAITLIKHRKCIHFKKRFSICIALGIELIVSFYQLARPWSLISGMGITLIVFALYMTLESPDSLLIEQLREEKVKVEKATRAKSSFVSNMSHEIRTPMNAIVGMTDILLRSELTTQQKGYLYNIKNSGNALLAIINDILDFSKIESGKMELVEDNYEPMSMLSDLGMIILNRIGEKPIELIFDIDKELPRKLYGDVNRVRQIIINLMNNAAKFTEEGYVQLTIRVKWLSEQEVELFVSVKDSGQGIREEDLVKLFGAFQQVDAKKNRNKEGTGLGLAICSQLVDLMGGSIDVKSEYGTGSEFYFTIKQKVVEKRAAAELKIGEGRKELPAISGLFQSRYILENVKQLAEEYGCTFMQEDDIDWKGENGTSVYPDYFVVDEIIYESCTELLAKMQEKGVTICILQNPMRYNFHNVNAKVLNKPLYSLGFCRLLNHEELIVEDTEKKQNYFTAPEAKILIVDDNEMNLKVAVGLLEPLKMKIDTAESGMRAIEMIQEKKHYHAVFMDHMMPVMDGVETTRRIRSILGEYYRNLPIIALTANVLTDAQEEFREAGMNDFVAKPIEFQKMCEVLRKWLPEQLLQELNSAEIAMRVQAEQDTQEDLPSIEGIDIAEGIKNSGSKELFVSLLGDFYKLIDMKSSKMKKCLADGLLRDYTIEVHALKNTARMIGAMKLSEWCYRLEQMGNVENKEILEEETPGMLELYQSYKAVLKPYGLAQEQEKREASIEEMVALLTTIKEATDNFDLDAVDDTSKELEKCQLPQDCIPLMEELRAYVADVAMEDILTTVDKMLQIVQK